LQQAATVKFPTYNADVIKEFASRLYRKAAAVAALFAICCSLIAAAIGGEATSYLNSTGKFGLLGVVLGGAFGLLVGLAVGRQLGFRWRLQAQLALCQVQIELNTRP
jgi:hypothetical protein